MKCLNFNQYNISLGNIYSKKTPWDFCFGLIFIVTRWLYKDHRIYISICQITPPSGTKNRLCA